MLYLQPEFGDRVRTIAPTYFSFEDASEGLDSSLRAGARRFDNPIAREVLAISAAALDVLEAEGFDTIIARATELAETFAAELAKAGRTVAQRDHSTLVAFEDADPEATRATLLEQGVGRAQPARLPVPAGLRGRVERRIGPRAAARRAEINAMHRPSACTAGRASAPTPRTSRRREHWPRGSRRAA